MMGGLVRRQEYTSSNKLYIILFFFSKVLLPVQVKINNNKKKTQEQYYNLVADSQKSCPHDLARHSTAGDHLWILAALVRSSGWS